MCNHVKTHLCEQSQYYVFIIDGVKQKESTKIQGCIKDTVLYNEIVHNSCNLFSESQDVLLLHCKSQPEQEKCLIWNLIVANNKNMNGCIHSVQGYYIPLVQQSFKDQNKYTTGAISFISNKVFWIWIYT